MASITCRNGGAVHSHSSVVESKICYGIIARPRPASLPPVVEEPATDKQINYVGILKGDKVAAHLMTKRQCTKYIDDLKSGRVSTVTAPIEEEPPPPVEVKATTKSDVVKAMLAMVPEGYFAVRQYDGAPITFMRLARPSHGKFRGCTKVSSQHGPALEVRWAQWPSGHVSVYRWPGHDIEEDLLMLIADWKSATRLYADKIKKCGRCNAKLTDPRSRFYLIGPECEKKPGWTWWIDEVADERGGHWEQQPLSVQEKYLPEYAEL